jgi:hydrogenase nickel incorporation protein HypA/HybF
MHERGIAEQMLKIALDYAAKNNAKRITAFNVEMSAAMDESEDSLRFHFENLTRGTLADGARVEISRVPVQAKCLECGDEFDWEAQDQVCPRCSSPRLRAVLHDEFRLASIDIE